MTTINDEVLYHVINILAERVKETRWHKSIVAVDGVQNAHCALRAPRDSDVVSEALRLIGNNNV